MDPCGSLRIPSPRTPEDEMTRASALSGARAPPPEVRVTRLEEKGAWAVEMRRGGPSVSVLTMSLWTQKNQPNHTVLVRPM